MGANSVLQERDPNLMRDYMDWRSRWMADKSTAQSEAFAAFKAGHMLGMVRAARDPAEVIMAEIPTTAGLLPKVFMKLFEKFGGKTVRITIHDDSLDKR